MKSKLILLLTVVLVELLLLRLGFWQLSRAAQKQQQLDALQVVLTQKHAGDISTASPQNTDFDWVQGILRFQTKPMLLLDNQRRGQQVGVIVYQAGLNESGQAFLVDLGWLPVAGNRQFPMTVPLTGPVAVSGLLMPPPSAGIAMGNAQSQMPDGRLLLTRMDLPALAKQLQKPLANRVLRLDPALPIGYQRDLDVQANTLSPEKHRAYAVQWFGLAVALLLLCVYGYRRKKV